MQSVFTIFTILRLGHGFLWNGHFKLIDVNLVAAAFFDPSCINRKDSVCHEMSVKSSLGFADQ